MGEEDVQRILVVEDDPFLREAEVRMIDGAFNWKAAGAGSLREAVQLLSDPSYIAILLDLGLPDAKGLDGLRSIRQLCPRVAIVVITGQTEEETAFQALAFGAQEYLVKGRLDRHEIQRTLRYAIHRKQAERATLNSNVLLASTLDAFNSAIAVVGSEGRIFATNSRWRSWTEPNPLVNGLGPGSDYINLCRELEDSQHLGTTIAAKGVIAVSENRMPTFVVDYPNDQEPSKWFGLTATGFWIDKTMHLLICVTNITERIIRIAEMKKHQRLFKLITDHATDLIAIVDSSGKRLYTSPSYERTLGWTQEEMEADPPLALVHPDDRFSVKQALEHVSRRGVGVQLVYRMIKKDGHYLTFESHSSLVRDPQGNENAVLFSARDITSKVQAELERDRMELQLRSAQKLEAIGQLAAGIAHEINTPIQYVGDNTRFLGDSFKSLNNLLAKYRNFMMDLDSSIISTNLRDLRNSLIEDKTFEYLNEEIPRAAEETLEGVSRVANIVKALKEFSYPMGDEPVMMDVNHCIETTVMVARNEWKYSAELTMDLSKDLPHVAGFPGEFNQVILNLIVNSVHAIQYTQKDRNGEKGIIYVKTWSDENNVFASIKDSGNGIPIEIQNRIFDPFFTTKEVGKGTGQGLAIAHVVMEKHHGCITFESSIGSGTTFYLQIPRKRVEQPSQE